MLSGEQPRVLKVAEVARRLQVDPRTVYGLIRRGELRGVKAGRVWRVPIESLEAFLQAAGKVGRRDRVYESPPGETRAARDQVARVKAIRGKYRDALSSVDEYVARKQEEIARENRRWSSENP
jgi:excisionase family DNA binding protein